MKHNILETITFTRHDDGTVTADGFPERIAISPALLAASDPGLMRCVIEYGQFHVHLKLANGRATYEVIEVDYLFGAPLFVAELQTKSMQP